MLFKCVVVTVLFAVLVFRVHTDITVGDVRENLPDLLRLVDVWTEMFGGEEQGERLTAVLGDIGESQPDLYNSLCEVCEVSFQIQHFVLIKLNYVV